MRTPKHNQQNQLTPRLANHGIGTATPMVAVTTGVVPVLTRPPDTRMMRLFEIAWVAATKTAYQQIDKGEEQDY